MAVLPELSEEEKRRKRFDPLTGEFNYPPQAVDTSVEAGDDARTEVSEETAGALNEEDPVA